MARDIKQLHPRLQTIIPKLIAECKNEGITIKVGECLRTVKEQDALYAKGRTAAGSIVTNAKGSTYSSMHQWGVAFDFFLDMDIDGDGTKSDDAFNNKKKTFQKVGAIGKKLGLEWGGDWKSPVDLPHFQLPDWGSTASKLKKQYKTPEKFFATWKKAEKKEAKKAEKEAKKASIYYPKYTGKEVEVDVVLKAIGVPARYRGSFKARKPLATKNGILLYKGTAKQNTKIINLAKKGKLKRV